MLVANVGILVSPANAARANAPLIAVAVVVAGRTAVAANTLIGAGPAMGAGGAFIV